jgi:hypothetical protein
MTHIDRRAPVITDHGGKTQRGAVSPDCARRGHPVPSPRTNGTAPASYSEIHAHQLTLYVHGPWHDDIGDPP